MRYSWCEVDIFITEIYVPLQSPSILNVFCDVSFMTFSVSESQYSILGGHSDSKHTEDGTGIQKP